MVRKRVLGERLGLRHDAAGDAPSAHGLRRRVPRADRRPPAVGRPRFPVELPRGLQVRLALLLSFQ